MTFLGIVKAKSAVCIFKYVQPRKHEILQRNKLVEKTHYQRKYRIYLAFTLNDSSVTGECDQ